MNSIASLFSIGLCLSTVLTACAAPKAATKPAKATARPAAASLVLAQNGRTPYVIALAHDAIPAEQTAARELSDYIQQISGAKLAVKPETEVAGNAPQILVGAGARAKKLLPTQNWAALGNDGVVIKTLGQNLILAGGRPRGSLYAVYSLLEEKFGVRWWTPEETTVPKQSTLKLAPQNTAYTPKLQTREAFYASTMWADPRFATRLKVNGHFQKQGPELGGHNSILGWCHTFIQLLPPEKYFKDHPEWYSDPTNGDKPCTAASPMPQGHTWQLCLSNEEARKELTRNALQWIKANPEAGTISISQNDTHTARCMCPADMAREKAEGSPAGPLLHFVNQVAADIEKVYPDFLVETLAYNYTQKPPLHEKPRRNVVMRLCAAADVDVTKPFDTAANATIRNQITTWKAIAPRLYVWNYVTNFSNYLIPHPNLGTMGPDIRFLTANNTIALFEQGDSANRAGDFTALRTWLVSRLMWNPALDQRMLENEFLNGYFGAAGPHLREYLDIIQKAGAGHKLSMYVKEYPYLTLEVMNAATRAFRAAEAAVASSPELSRRVLRERLALDHAWILRYRELQREAEKQKVTFEGPVDLGSFVLGFVRNTKGFDVTQYSEGTPFESYAARLQARYGPVAALPASIKAPPGSDVLDVQDLSFTLYEQGATTSLVDDAKASDQRAARFIANSFVWAVQYPLSLEDGEYLQRGQWRAYALVRTEAKPGAPKTGDAFVCGIYDGGTSKNVVELKPPVAEVAGDDYKVLDLGTHALTKSCYFWFASTKNKNVDSFYVDRIVMVRESVRP